MTWYFLVSIFLICMSIELLQLFLNFRVLLIYYMAFSFSTLGFIVPREIATHALYRCSYAYIVAWSLKLLNSYLKFFKPGVCALM